MDPIARRIARVLFWLTVGFMLGMVTLSCAGRVHDRPRETAQETLEDMTWCVAATIGKRRLVACTDSWEACRVWRKQARLRGKWVGVTSMSSCELVKFGRGD